MKIFIVGSGKLASSILSSNLLMESYDILKWDVQYQSLNEKTIVVHAGSGRQLAECMGFCSRTKSIFIELSTGLETEKLSPDFPLVVCPNTSILVLKALNMVKANAKQFENYDITITESHQSTKKTEPGTAIAFANVLNYPVDKIISIRDSKIQQSEIGIPVEYLDKHAYHRIVIKDGDDEIAIETKVLGHKSYAKGVKEIVKAAIKSSLENKRYMVWDII
jgi:dihydrodipicolinate reductase